MLSRNWIIFLIFALSLKYFNAFIVDKVPLSSTSACRDSVDNCFQFPKTYCFGTYETWARTNCPAYCGYCDGSATGIVCPTCDENLSCTWNQTCGHDQICMVRSVSGRDFSTHCIRRDDCEIMKSFVQNSGEIFCCRDRQCLSTYLGV
ncbi:uncharacterized protein LOC111126932 [Crassostrea virginica]